MEIKNRPDTMSTSVVLPQAPTDSNNDVAQAASTPSNLPIEPGLPAVTSKSVEAQAPGVQSALAAPVAAGVGLAAPVEPQKPQAPLPGAEYVRMAEVADDKGQKKFDVYGEFAYRNNNGLVPGQRHDDALTMGLYGRVIFKEVGGTRLYGFDIDADAYIGTQRPGEFSRDRPRTDELTLKAWLGDSFALADSVKLDYKLYAGVLVEGKLGLRTIQNEWHRLHGLKRVDAQLTNNYPGERAYAALVGGEVGVTKTSGNLSATVGASLDLALGQTGVSRVGPFAQLAYRFGDTGLEVMAFGQARYQVVTGHREPLHETGHIDRAVNVNLGAGVAYERGDYRVSLTVETDHQGSRRGVDLANLRDPAHTSLNGVLAFRWKF